MPEIGAENRHQKTGIINLHENTASPIRYQKLIPEKSGINYMSDASETGTGFRRRFLASVSLV